MNFRSRSICSC